MMSSLSIVDTGVAKSAICKANFGGNQWLVFSCNCIHVPFLQEHQISMKPSYLLNFFESLKSS